MSDSPPVLRPIPQRTFDITPASAESSAPSTPLQETREPSASDLKPACNAPSRTSSVLNLTSSTLFGIYSPTSHGSSRGEPVTPWTPGSQTPAANWNSPDEKSPPVLGVFKRPSPQRATSHRHQSLFSDLVLPLALRTVTLFLFGMAYGVIITHLHDDQRLAPVQMEGIDRSDWRYNIFWGIAGVLLGSLLPWVDVFWQEAWGTKKSHAEGDIVAYDSKTAPDTDGTNERLPSRSGSSLGADWNPAVRSIGAFVGIAFAIVSEILGLPTPLLPFSLIAVLLQRKLPWQSTLQVSLTLALVNPVLWYLIDRSKTGLLLSAFVGISGTAVLLGVNPDVVPPPSTSSPLANTWNVSYESVISDKIISNESIGVGTWIASVLFCSCVCFGNIGRRLAPSQKAS